MSLISNEMDFIDGPGGGDWGAGSSSYGPYNPAMPSHLSQSSYPGPNTGGPGSMHQLPPSHDPMGGYAAHPGIPSTNDSPLIASSLPPMSTFRGGNPGGPGGGGGPGPVVTSTVNNTTSPLYNNHSPVIVPSNASGQTGDTVGKALASVSKSYDRHLQG